MPEFRPGDRVGLWARPAEETIYVFGFGTYEEMPSYAGSALACVRLDNGYLHIVDPQNRKVSIGSEASITNACQNFKGLVEVVDIGAYLNNQLTPTRSRTETVAPPADEPDDKSVLGMFKHKMAQATYERHKIEMLEGHLKDSRSKLKALVEEIRAMRENAMSEFETLEKLVAGEPVAEPQLQEVKP